MHQSKHMRVDPYPVEFAYRTAHLRKHVCAETAARRGYILSAYRGQMSSSKPLQKMTSNMYVQLVLVMLVAGKCSLLIISV